MPPELLSIFAGLASAVTYGAGDFSGGYASRRSRATMVVLVSQFSGLLILLLLALLQRAPLPPASDLLAAGIAGTLGTIGLVQYYQELSRGRMGVIAPLTAVVTVTIPVLYGSLSLGLPSPSQLVGMLLALAAIYLITRAGSHAPVTRRDLGIVLVMGALFSVFLVTIGTVSARSIFWPLIASRAASASFLLLFLLLNRRGSLTVVSGDRLALMAFVGLLDIAGSSLFALSSAMGRLDIASVLASLYPAVTVLLARFVLSEPINGRQWLGILVAVAAIILITL
ncbi:MAG: EamA family transporter [Candidatus Promineifilaceae bacterium]